MIALSSRLPKIKTLHYLEVAAGSELDAVKSAKVHYTNPSASMETVNDITSAKKIMQNLAIFCPQ